MTPRISFYLDEHFPPGVAEGLRARGVDALSAREAGRLSFSDEEQLAFAVAQGRVMVTQDEDYPRMHRKGVVHSGIVYFLSPRRSIGEYVASLHLIHTACDAAAFRGWLEFL